MSKTTGTGGADQRLQLPLPRPLIAALAAVLAVSACVAAPGGTQNSTAARGSAASKVSAPGAAAPLSLAPPPAAGLARVVANGEQAVSLIGKVKLLSDLGGALISDQGGGVVSNNGGGLISDKGGALIGKTKLRLAQADPGNAELLLADAIITVHDAAGKQLVDAAGVPLQTRSDAQGSYRLVASLPNENLVLRVQLWNGGELASILVRGTAATREVPIDTASTLGATYVIDRFVRAQPDPRATFDKLPQAEAERLHGEFQAARALLPPAPRYEAAALVQLADDLREKVPAVDQALQEIEVLLLGGLGDGRLATRVALARPRAVAVAADGTLIIGEQDLGRLRRVASDGTLTTWVDSNGGTVKTNFHNLKDLLMRPDGSLLIASNGLKQVIRLPASGPPEPFAGSGRAPAAGDAESGLATALALQPSALALDATGQVWIGQDAEARLWVVGVDGQARRVPGPATWGANVHLTGLATGPDDALYALGRRGTVGEVQRRAPDGAWDLVAEGLGVKEGDVAVTPDGTIFVAEDFAARLVIVKAGAPPVVVAGEGAPPGAPTLLGPAGLHVGPDGTLYVSDRTANQVFGRAADGAWRVVAGATQAVQVGAGGDLAINLPASVAFDRQGLMILSESAGHTVKRWDGTSLVVIAGSTRGNSGDGGPATEAKLDSPVGIAFRGEELVVADSLNARVRAIAPDGTIKTLVGVTGQLEGRALQPGERVAADAYVPERCTQLAVAPDGSMYWTSMSLDQIVRLRPDGQVELVAGKPYADGEQHEDGEDGPAAEVGLSALFGLALDPADPDVLYFTELINMRVRRVVGLLGANPRIETVAGLGRIGTLGRLLDLEPGWERAEEGISAREALFIGPTAVTVDRDGSLLIAEVGTDNISQLATDPSVIGALGQFASTQARVRRVGRDGRVTTVVGPGSGDALGMPTALALDPQGRLAVVDIRANAIRILSLAEGTRTP